jgi:hypothetical protein
MSELLDLVLQAHGGLDRWNKFSSVTATIVTGGGLWPMKGLKQDSNPREMTVTLHEETASVSPFGQPDWRSAFTPDRIAIETTAQEAVDAALRKHGPGASWVYMPEGSLTLPVCRQRLLKFHN